MQLPTQQDFWLTTQRLPQWQALQLLHVKVLMSKAAGEPEIEGWVRPGLSSNTH
jgi:hypothetical protein